MSFFSIWSLEGHFPNVKDIIIFNFLAVIPWHFIRINGWGVKDLWIPIDHFVYIPVETTRTLPEFYRVVLVTSKEAAEATKYGYSMILLRVWQWIEYFLGYIDGISDHNDFENVFLDMGLVNTVPNRKEFSFSACDKGHIV